MQLEFSASGNLCLLNGFFQPGETLWIGLRRGFLSAE